jgi:catechol 2,3-dioxygenase-like lactoylglutathione lyase family enzyme
MSYTFSTFDERSTAVPNTFHLSLDVPDLEASVAFYRELFGVEPAKAKPGYAKFELADPPVALALQQAAAGARGLNHAGIRVDDTRTVEEASTRLRESGLVTLDERDTACCYARQDKVWVADPAGHRWEIYTVLEDVEENDEPVAACCGEECCR